MTAKKAESNVEKTDPQNRRRKEQEQRDRGWRWPTECRIAWIPSLPGAKRVMSTAPQETRLTTLSDVALDVADGFRLAVAVGWSALAFMMLPFAALAGCALAWDCGSLLLAGALCLATLDAAATLANES